MNPNQPKSPTGPNLGRNERTASVALGAALAVAGASRPKQLGFLCWPLAAAMLQRGITGNSWLYWQMGIRTVPNGGHEPAVRVHSSATILKPVEEVQRSWVELGGLEPARVEIKAAPNGRGTELHATLHYTPRFGVVEAAAGKITQHDPQATLNEALAAFKSAVETGELIEA